MNTFNELKLTNPLRNAISDLELAKPTPIQEKSFSVILSGKDMVGIAQTGTGKTFAYLLPILRELKYTTETTPKVLILVPTRELVLQVVEQAKLLAKYMNVKILGVYGGTNINTQKRAVQEHIDIIVATPGRLYDLALTKVLKLKTVRKLVIDEVDVMLDLGFRFQLSNIFEFLPKKRQNIMFSATMTEEIDDMINSSFTVPQKISIAVSGTPLDNISQKCYQVRNFYTKVNLLSYLLDDSEEYSKVLVFTPSKRLADKLFEELEEKYDSEMGIIHSNKSQNYRIRSIKHFNEGKNRILVATDIMARGLDLDKISHVINFDTPDYPENYIHRIGRTGRAEEEGKSILFYTIKEEKSKRQIENLMAYEIPELDFPEEVEINPELIPEERPRQKELNTSHKVEKTKGAAFHEKKDKNKKTNQGGSYLKKMKVYKKPKTRGDKRKNLMKKK